MAKKPPLSLKLFVLVTALAGAGSLGFDAWASRASSLLGPRPEIVGALAVGCLLAELRPLRWIRLEEGGDYPVINVECLERFCGKVRPDGSQEKPACVAACLFGALTMTERGKGDE